MDAPQANVSRGGDRRTLNGCLTIVLIVIAAGLLLPFLMRGCVSPNAAVGKPLAALEVVPFADRGEPITLADLKGKVVLVNFWATWCGPCLAELPHTAELHRQLASREDFVLLAVSCGEEDPVSLAANTKETLRRLNLDLPVYTDPNETTQDAFQDLAGQMGFPTNFVLDRKGVIRKVWVGYGPGLEDEIRATIENLLEERPKTEPRS
ncbi:MAG TPA: TlpA disulfide reductase family protein [Thermoguttaceae bacterium]|nr:TlpA disulfide reductase family protein [Thermoguttaceae bacterium]